MATNSNLKHGVGQAKQSAGWWWRGWPPAVVKRGRVLALDVGRRVTPRPGPQPQANFRASVSGAVIAAALCD